MIVFVFSQKRRKLVRSKNFLFWPTKSNLPKIGGENERENVRISFQKNQSPHSCFFFSFLFSSFFFWLLSVSFSPSLLFPFFFFLLLCNLIQLVSFTLDKTVPLATISLLLFYLFILYIYIYIYVLGFFYPSIFPHLFWLFTLF